MKCYVGGDTGLATGKTHCGKGVTGRRKGPCAAGPRREKPPCGGGLRQEQPPCGGGLGGPDAEGHPKDFTRYGRKPGGGSARCSGPKRSAEPFRDAVIDTSVRSERSGDARVRP